MSLSASDFCLRRAWVEIETCNVFRRDVGDHHFPDDQHFPLVIIGQKAGKDSGRDNQCGPSSPQRRWTATLMSEYSRGTKILMLRRSCYRRRLPQEWGMCRRRARAPFRKSGGRAFPLCVRACNAQDRPRDGEFQSGAIGGSRVHPNQKTAMTASVCINCAG